MMAALNVYLERLKTFCLQMVSQIEESQYFERAMIRYENADPRSQKRIVLGTYAGILLIVLGIFLLPLMSLWSTKSQLASVRNLTTDVKAYNAKGNITYKAAPPPMGWQPVTAANVEEFEQSITQFLSSMGIPTDLTTIAKTGEGLEIKTTGASLRQLSALLFLFDGWHPGVKVKNLETNVNKDSRETIDFTVLVDFDAVEASKVAAGHTGDPASAINSFMKSSTGPTSSSGAPGGNNFDYNAGGNGSSPPPPSSGDFEDYSEPMEPPPDLPPPPPLEEDL